MVAGFQVFNADGSLQFDTTSRLFRLIQEAALSNSSGNMTIPGLSSQGTPIPIFVNDDDDNDDAETRQISVSGDTVSWPAGQSGKLMIMVY